MDDILRARNWEEFVGQDEIKARLAVHIAAAVTEDRMLDHLLLAGPPGCGKTSLAHIVAHQLGDEIKELTMPVQPVALLEALRDWDGGVLFLDEIHRAPKRQQEDLLPLLESGYLQTPDGRRVHVAVTVIGATTEPEKVIPPLYDRFPLKPAYVEYSDEQMAEVVHRMAGRLDLDLDKKTCYDLGKATAGTPRNGRQFVLAARDLAALGRPAPVTEILNLCGTEKDGLTAHHLAYLRALVAFDGQAGIDRLAITLSLSATFVQQLERVLVRLGLVRFGERGRKLTEAGWSRTEQRQPMPVAARRARR